MRKKIITLILSLFVLGISQAQVVFDPATYSGTLKPGMSVVQIDGVSYLQVIVDGWNSTIDIPKTAISGTGLKTTIKYNTIDGYQQVSPTLIGGIVQLMDTVNTYVPSWGGTAPTNIQLVMNPIDDTLAAVQGSYMEGMEYMYQVQFAGQERFGGWGARTGDTLWCGKIEYIADNVVFDPATFTGTLGDGMSIVEVSGEKYLKVTSQASWTHVLAIDEYNSGIYNTITGKLIYGAGTSSLAKTDAQTVVNIGISTGIASLSTLKMYPSSTEPFECQGTIDPNTTIDQLQFFVQDATTADWATVAGAEIYVGKITASFVELEPVDPPRKAIVNYIGDKTETVTVDGLYDDAFDYSNTYFVNRIALGTVDGVSAAAEDAETVQDSTKYTVSENLDSYGEWLAVWDLDYFYFYMDINDDTPVELGTSTSPWNNDGVEIFVDIKDRRYVGYDRKSTEQHQFRFSLGTEGPLHGLADGVDAFGMDGSTFGDNDTTNINYSINKATSAYSLEFAIPWATFFKTGANTVKEAYLASKATGALFDGKELAFEVSILDAEVRDTRQSILNWSNDTGQDKAYVTTQYWGQIKLKGGPVSVNDKPAMASLKVFPNPTNGELYIMMNNVTNVEVFNLLGAKVLENNAAGISSVNVSELNDGFYMIKATDANGHTAVSKFKKQ